MRFFLKDLKVSSELLEYCTKRFQQPAMWATLGSSYVTAYSVSPITFFLFQTEYVNMTQFMKKYMIQTLYMDAWDLGTFYIGDQLFLGVSQLGGKSFVIYKWDSGNRYTKDLKHFLCFKC